MNDIENIARSITPELNHLLSTRPFYVNGGVDFGWFCREHAFCTVVILGLRQIPCEIVRGGIVITFQGKGLSTEATGDEHYWCQSVDIPVLDLSIQLDEFFPGSGFRPPIVGLRPNGSFNVQLLSGPASAEAFDADREIVYIGRNKMAVSALDLLSSPTGFLRTKESFDMSCRIALHAHYLLLGRREAFQTRYSQKGALRELRNSFPEAHEQLTHELRECRATRQLGESRDDGLISQDCRQT